MKKKDILDEKNIETFCEFIHFCSKQELSYNEEDILYKYNSHVKKNEILEEFVKSNIDNICFILNTIEEFNTFYKITLNKQQITCSFFLYFDFFVELMTGSGKTYALCLAAVWFNKLSSRSVHVSTFTDYLSRRDFNELKPFYESLDMKVTYINDLDYENSDVIYGSNSEFIFKYLYLIEDMEKYTNVTKNYLDVILLDESDGLLIEKDLTSHIINLNIKILNSEFSKRINFFNINNEHFERIVDFTFKTLKEKKDYFNTDLKKIKKLNHYGVPKITYSGLQKISKFQKNDTFFCNFPSSTYFLILSILIALNKIQNVDFIVEDNSIISIDEYSGERNPQSKFGNLVHEALETLYLENKEHNFIKDTSFSSSMTAYSYLNLYKTCLGVSGTNSEIQKVIYDLFKKKVYIVKQHFPGQKKTYILRTFEDQVWSKKESLLRDITKFFPSPILILTDNPLENEDIYIFLKNRLSYEKRKDIYILDAINEQKKKMIVDRKCGKEKCIVVSTNIISRGVDIQVTHKSEKNFNAFKNWYEKQKKYTFINNLPNKCYIFDEILDVFDKEISKFNKRNKGLVVILNQCYSDSRIDKQAMGRTARMGKDGTIIRYFSFDESISRETKISPISLTKISLSLFEFFKKWKIKIFNIDKYIFLLVKRLQNINFSFKYKLSEETKLKDLFLNGYMKKRYLLIHTTEESMLDFLNQFETLVNRLTLLKRKVIFDSIDKTLIIGLPHKNLKNIIYYIRNQVKNGYFLPKYTTMDYLVKCNLLGYLTIMKNSMNNIGKEDDSLDNNFFIESCLFFFSTLINSILEKIFNIRTQPGTLS